MQTFTDSQIYFVASLPNIGREKARYAAEIVSDTTQCVINVDDWSKTVHGLGPVISNRVKEVLNQPFREQGGETPLSHKVNRFFKTNLSAFHKQ